MYLQEDSNNEFDILPGFMLSTAEMEVWRKLCTSSSISNCLRLKVNHLTRCQDNVIAPSWAVLTQYSSIDLAREEKQKFIDL